MARRNAAAGALAAAALALAAAGCDTIRENVPEVQLSVLEPSNQQDRPRESGEPRVFVKQPIERVERFEVGATTTGFMMAVFGLAPATNWFAPELRPRHGGGPGPDGFIELDFFAAPPEANAGEPGLQGPPQARQVRADYEITREQVARALGVRVHALTNSIESRFR